MKKLLLILLFLSPIIIYSQTEKIKSKEKINYSLLNDTVYDKHIKHRVSTSNKTYKDSIKQYPPVLKERTIETKNQQNKTNKYLENSTTQNIKKSSKSINKVYNKSKN